MAAENETMRSIQELLRDYNFVNTPEGRRNTVRFFAGAFVFAAGAFMVIFIAFGGGNAPDTTFQEGQRSGDPFELAATKDTANDNKWYIGYDPALYSPEHRDGYSEAAIQEKFLQWTKDYDGLIIHTEPVRSGDEHDVLLGYNVYFQGGVGLGILTR